MPQRHYTSIKTQRTSASGASGVAHASASSVSYQSTIHHVITGVNDNDDSCLFETHRENNRSYSCSYYTINIATAPNLSKLSPTVK